MLKAGVSTACLYPQPLEEAFYELALSGVQQAEVFINSHSELKKSFVMGLVDIVKRFGIGCCSMHPFTSEMEPMMFFSNYNRRVHDMLDYYKYYFAAMEALDAKVFVMHGNKAPISAEAYAEKLYMIIKAAEDFGVTVALENVARCTTRSLEFMAELKSLMGKDAAFVLDIKQAVRSGVNPFSALDSLSDSIVHVHISDHGAFGDCLTIGNGSFKVRDFLAKLKDVSPDCTAVLELYRNAFGSISDLIQNYQVLERMVQSLYE